MSYVALDEEYLNALLEVGYHDTMAILRARGPNLFVENEEETGGIFTSERVIA
jgi:hypothetical protein